MAHSPSQARSGGQIATLVGLSAVLIGLAGTAAAVALASGAGGGPARWLLVLVLVGGAVAALVGYRSSNGVGRAHWLATWTVAVAWSSAAAVGGMVAWDTWEHGVAVTGPGSAGEVYAVELAVPAVGGGTVDVADYHGRPVVIVFAQQEQRLADAVERTLALTDGGTTAQVVAVLDAVPGDDFEGSLLDPSDTAAFVRSVSSPELSALAEKVPVGLDVKGAAGGEITGRVNEMQPGMPGWEEAVAVALVRSNGTLDRVVLASQADGQVPLWIDEQH